MNLNQYIEHLQSLVADNPDDGLLTVYSVSKNCDESAAEPVNIEYARLTIEKGTIRALNPDDEDDDDRIQLGIILYSE